MRHTFFNSPPACTCHWCGLTVDNAAWPCPVDNEIRDAIASYAIAQGPFWKTQLRQAWRANEYPPSVPDKIAASLDRYKRLCGSGALIALPGWVVRRWALATPGAAVIDT